MSTLQEKLDRVNADISKIDRTMWGDGSYGGFSWANASEDERDLLRTQKMDLLKQKAALEREPPDETPCSIEHDSVRLSAPAERSLGGMDASTTTASRTAAGTGQDIGDETVAGGSPSPVEEDRSASTVGENVGAASPVAEDVGGAIVIDLTNDDDGNSTSNLNENNNNSPTGFNAAGGASRAADGGSASPIGADRGSTTPTGVDGGSEEPAKATNDSNSSSSSNTDDDDDHSSSATSSTSVWSASPVGDGGSPVDSAVNLTQDDSPGANSDTSAGASPVIGVALKGETTPDSGAPKKKGRPRKDVSRKREGAANQNMNSKKKKSAADTHRSGGDVLEGPPTRATVHQRQVKEEKTSAVVGGARMDNELAWGRTENVISAAINMKMDDRPAHKINAKRFLSEKVRGFTSVRCEMNDEPTQVPADDENDEAREQALHRHHTDIIKLATALQDAADYFGGALLVDLEKVIKICRKDEGLCQYLLDSKDMTNLDSRVSRHFNNYCRWLSSESQLEPFPEGCPGHPRPRFLRMKP
eukprot:g4421.t1